jgi:hypothetical protein
VRTAESAALEALRKIQSAAFAGGIEEIRVRMSPVAALLLLNSKRQILSDFERQSNTRILIYADGRMKPDEYGLELSTTQHGTVHPEQAQQRPHPGARMERERGAGYANDSGRRDDRDDDSDDEGQAARGQGNDGRGRRGRDRRSSRRNNRRNRGRRDGRPQELQRAGGENSAGQAEGGMYGGPEQERHEEPQRPSDAPPAPAFHPLPDEV